MINSFVYDLLKAVLTLFIIIDPLGNVPTIIGLTENMSQDERKSALQTAAAVSLILLITFTVLGQQVLNIFGISINNFKIAGGLLLLIIAVKILVYGEWRESKISPEKVGAAPIAFPLLVGPGAITTTIVILETSGIAVTIVSALINFGMIWIVMRFIESIYSYLGKVWSTVIARVMAVFIAAIGVGYIIEGVEKAFS